jgi:hypothetical protein
VLSALSTVLVAVFEAVAIPDLERAQKRKTCKTSGAASGSLHNRKPIIVRILPCHVVGEKASDLSTNSGDPTDPILPCSDASRTTRRMSRRYSFSSKSPPLRCQVRRHGEFPDPTPPILTCLAPIRPLRRHSRSRYHDLVSSRFLRYHRQRHLGPTTPPLADEVHVSHYPCCP